MGNRVELAGIYPIMAEKLAQMVSVVTCIGGRGKLSNLYQEPIS